MYQDICIRQWGTNHGPRSAVVSTSINNGKGYQYSYRPLPGGIGVVILLITTNTKANLQLAYEQYL